MSFTTAVTNIFKNLFETFKKAVEPASKGEADAEQTFRDAEKAGEDTGSKSTEAASDEVKKHLTKMDSGTLGENLKSVKDLGDKVMKSAPKVGSAVKSGWLEFVGVVTAIFAAAMVYVYSQTPSGPSPAQKAASDAIYYAELEVQQVERMNQFAISDAQFHIMLGGLEVQYVPNPSDPVPVAVLPNPIAVVAAVPVAVQVTTPAGTRTFETTFGQVYANAPPPVQEYMVNNPPATNDEEKPEQTEDQAPDLYVPSEHHKTFTVEGTPFGSATFSY